MTREEARLQADRDCPRGSAKSDRTVYWKRWGPYLSERQWGTVREDYSDNGEAWDYFTHEQARSRAYRWGEDGIAGISDNHQRLCFANAVACAQRDRSLEWRRCDSQRKTIRFNRK